MRASHHERPIQFVCVFEWKSAALVTATDLCVSVDDASSVICSFFSVDDRICHRENFIGFYRDIFVIQLSSHRNFIFTLIVRSQ